jgi:hypothetical protein
MTNCHIVSCKCECHIDDSDLYSLKMRNRNNSKNSINNSSLSNNRESSILNNPRVNSKLFTNHTPTLTPDPDNQLTFNNEPVSPVKNRKQEISEDYSPSVNKRSTSQIPINMTNNFEHRISNISGMSKDLETNSPSFRKLRDAKINHEHRKTSKYSNYLMKEEIEKEKEKSNSFLVPKSFNKDEVKGVSGIFLKSKKFLL